MARRTSYQARGGDQGLGRTGRGKKRTSQGISASSRKQLAPTPPARSLGSYANEVRELAMSEPVGGLSPVSNPLLSASTGGRYSTTNTLFSGPPHSAADLLGGHGDNSSSTLLLRAGTARGGSGEGTLPPYGNGSSGALGDVSVRQASSGLVLGTGANPGRPTHPASGPATTSMRKLMLQTRGSGGQGLGPLRGAARGAGASGPTSYRANHSTGLHGGEGGEAGDDHTEDIFDNTQMLSTLRGFTNLRLSEDKNSAAAYSRGVVGGDGSRAFALGSTLNKGNPLRSDGGGGGGNAGGGAKKPKPPQSKRRMDSIGSQQGIHNPSSSSSPTSASLTGVGVTQSTIYPGSGFALRQEQQPTRSVSPPAAASSSSANPTAGKAISAPQQPHYDFRVVLSSGKTSTAAIELSVGSGCVQGMRPTMEDEHFAMLNKQVVRDQPVSLVAILDGHCGRNIAELGAKWIPEYFFSHDLIGDNNALALVESILQSDRTIYSALSSKCRNSTSSSLLGGRDLFGCGDDGMSGGSTLITAAVHGRMLYVGCLGDARAVLYDGHTTIAMSEDHKPGNTKEKQRITKCGGFVQLGRVCGVLAVSRALGDYEFKFGSGSSASSAVFGMGGTIAGKDANRLTSNRPLMVSNVADVRQINLTDESKFLLLACDGLWDVLSNEEATQFVKDFLMYTPDINDPLAASGKKPKPTPAVINRALNNCCQKLSEFAVERGSTDNVSVMVVFFHDVVDVVASFNASMPSSSPRNRSVSRRHHGGAQQVSSSDRISNVLLGISAAPQSLRSNSSSSNPLASPRLAPRLSGTLLPGVAAGGHPSPRAGSLPINAERFSGSYYPGGVGGGVPEPPPGRATHNRSKPLW